jgi:hypothetical protein
MVIRGKKQENKPISILITGEAKEKKFKAIIE